MINAFSAVALLLMVFLAGSFESYRMILSLVEPVRYHSVSIVNDEPIKSEGILRLRYRFYRDRLCQTTVDRFIVGTPTEDIIFRDRIVGGASPLGDHDVLNTMQLPQLAPGEYELRTHTQSICLEGPHMVTAPFVHFTVEK